MSPRFVLGRENVPCVAEVVNRSLKADCTDFMLEMFVKLTFQCVRLKKHYFALVVMNRFPICFYQGLFTRCDLYHRFLFYYSAETKEMIYESVNLKGVVYEPKQNSFSLHHN